MSRSPVIIHYLLAIVSIGVDPALAQTPAGGAESRAERNATADDANATTVSDSGDAADEAPEERRIRLSDQGELDRAKSLYDAGNYDQCAESLESLLDPNAARPLTDPSVIERARLYQATCLVMLDRREPARAVLRAALEANPMMPEPERMVFPPPLVDLYLEVRDEVRQMIQAREDELRKELEERAAEQQQKAEAARERLAELERLASEERLVLRNRRWIAAVPFGVGQFQNGDEALGWTFLVSETVLAGVALGSMAVSLHLWSQSPPDADGTLKDPVDLSNKLQLAHTTLLISGYGFLSVAAIGIAEAQLNFVPEQHVTRVRPLPPRLQQTNDEDNEAVDVSVHVIPLDQGAGIGVLGTF